MSPKKANNKKSEQATQQKYINKFTKEVQNAIFPFNSVMMLLPKLQWLLLSVSVLLCAEKTKCVCLKVQVIRFSKFFAAVCALYFLFDDSISFFFCALCGASYKTWLCAFNRTQENGEKKKKNKEKGQRVKCNKSALKRKSWKLFYAVNGRVKSIKKIVTYNNEHYLHRRRQSDIRGTCNRKTATN